MFNFKNITPYSGGAFEHEAVMKLISERCSKLVPILSPNFFSSESNNFFTLFAQHLGITEEKRKIIPIIYQDCRIPANLGIYHKLQVKLIFRAPDPLGSAFIFPFGSVSGSRREKLLNNNWKNAGKLVIMEIFVTF